MQSPWEILTRGQCNNSLPLIVKRDRRKANLTARQVKDAAMRANHIAMAKARADKIDALEVEYLSGSDDRVGANAERKAMRQTWLHRTMNPSDMYKSKNSKPSACVIKKG